MRKILRPLFFILILLLLIGTACQALVPSGEPTSTPVPVQVTGIALVPPTLARPTLAKVGTPAREVLPTRAATQTPLPPVLVDAPALVQTKNTLGVVFRVKNPNPDLAITSLICEVSVYDGAGTVLASHSIYITLLLPGEVSPVFDTFTLKDGQPPSRAEVKLKPTRFVSSDLRVPLFEAAQPTFYPRSNAPIVTGMILNKTDIGFASLKITALLYDAGGAISGGGYAYLNFLAADDQAPVKVYVQSNGEPARVELYASLTSLSQSSDGNPVPPSEVRLLDYGFSQANTIVSTAVVAQSQREDQALERAQYLIGLYDADGKVLECEQGYFNLVFPVQTIATSATFYLSKDQTAAWMSVQITGGSRSDHPITANPFQVEDITYLAGTQPKARATIKSVYPQDLKTVEVNVVAYNAGNKIIGGGRRYADLIPANGQIMLEVPLTVSQEPDRLEFFPEVTSITKIGTATTPP